VSTITVSDLKKRSAKQWSKSAKKGELVITSQGQPVAVLLPTNAGSLDATLSTLRSVRALQAQRSLQQAAEQNGTSELSISDIDAEITTARRARRK
jgi:antitoxin (DNA-binding transcriptional repressor) of toxin-antitoxin stability system